MTAPAPPLMEADGLTRLFARQARGFVRRSAPQRAVDGVSFSISAGETVALVGESGSGKSTVGRILLGLLAPSSGSVRYRGQDLATCLRSRSHRFRADVQAVFQDSGASLNPRRTVGRSVAVPLIYHLGLDRRAAEREADGLLDSVGLSPPQFRDRWPHELSGGQCQRVNIARALASNPSLIVADEPVSALDVSVRAQVLALMRRIQRERQLSYLFISHDLGAVQALADRIIVLYRGVVVEEGAAASVLSTPRHAYTQALLAARPSIAAAATIALPTQI